MKTNETVDTVCANKMTGCLIKFTAVVYIAAGFTGCGSPAGGVEPDYARTPVVFVHGLLVDNSYFDPMINHLRRRGWPSEYLHKVDFESRNMPNVLAAERYLAPEIETFIDFAWLTCKQQASECPEFNKVDIVAHSMGAVSTRWYAAKMRPDRVRTWISLGGANHGATPICPGVEGTGKRDLCPAYAETEDQNPVQYALNGSPAPDVDESPYGIGNDSQGVTSIMPDEKREILYLTIRVKNDEYVMPPESPTLDGAGGIELSLPPRLKFKETSPGNYLVLYKLGHDDIPADESVATFVELALTANR